MATATEGKKPLVDLDALEEERVQMEEKMLGFTIFSKRETLDPIDDNMMTDPDHHDDHPVDHLHAENNDNNDFIDSLHNDWKNIAAELEREDDPEAKEDDDEFGADHEHEEEHAAQEEEHHDEEKIHESLKAMVREHAGEDAVPEGDKEQQQNENEDEDDDSDDDDAGLKAQMPDFSKFNTQLSKQGMSLPGNSATGNEETGEELTFSFAAVQKAEESTAARKRVSGQSQIEGLLAEKKTGAKPRRKRPLRAKSAPLSTAAKNLRPGEEDNFFDWKTFARIHKRKQIGQDVSNLMDQEDPDLEAPIQGGSSNRQQNTGDSTKTTAETNETTETKQATTPQTQTQSALKQQPQQGEEEEDEEDATVTAQGGYLGGLVGMSGSAKNNNQNQNEQGDEMTFDFKSFRSAQQDSTMRKKVDDEHDDPTSGSNLLKIVKGKSHKKKLPPRSKSAPLGNMQRKILPGEEGGPSFDWKKFASEQQATKRKE